MQSDVAYLVFLSDGAPPPNVAGPGVTYPNHPPLFTGLTELFSTCTN